MKRTLISITFILSFVSIFANQNNNLPANKNVELAIANLYGYACYFNPNKKITDLDWTKFLIHTLRQSQYVSDNTDSVRIFLEKTFRPLIPNMKLTNSSRLTCNRYIITNNNNSNKAFFYKHFGFGSQKQFIGEDNFYSKIVHEECNGKIPIPDSLYSYKILNNIYLHFPLAITEQNKHYDKEFQNLKKTIDTIDLRLTKYSLLKLLIKKEFGYIPINHQDKSLFKANLIVRWNIMKHFYPYLKDESLSNEKMNYLLLTFLDKIDENITKKSADGASKERFEKYLYILKEFMANFKDGHINEDGIIMGTNKRVAWQIREYSPQIALDYIEDMIVSRFDLEGNYLKNGEKGRIKRGDKLVSVSGIPIDSLLSMKLKYIASSNERAKKEQFLKDGFLTTKQDSTFSFVFETSQGDSIRFLNKISDYSWGKVFKTYRKKTDFINNLGNGVYYIALSSKDLKEETFKNFISLHADSIKSLIFELREYPAPEAMDILAYISPEPILWGDYRIPIRYFPNQKHEDWTENELIHPKQPFLEGVSCYALVDVNSISYGESIANALKKNKLATLIGSNTSGINGDISRIKSPLFNFIMSVGKDFDGYHSVGITPDIHVSQTLDDYRKGKDTVLEYIKKLAVVSFQVAAHSPT